MFYYYVIKDNVAKDLSPVLRSTTHESAIRSLKADKEAMTIRDDLSIRCIGTSSDDLEFTPRKEDWIPLCSFLGVPPVPDSNVLVVNPYEKE